MQTLILVTAPAIVAAAGSVLSAYIAAKVRSIAIATNGRVGALEAELRLARAELAILSGGGSSGVGGVASDR